MHIDKLDDIVHEYNNTYHTAVDVMSRRYIDFGIENNDKDLNLKLMIMWKYLNTKIFLQKLMVQIGLEEFLWLRS